MNKPTIYSSPENVGISPTVNAGEFGPLGEIWAVTFHHSAGPRAKNQSQAKALHRAYQRDHIERGFGDIGYHFSIDDLGHIYKLRSIHFKGAHVGSHNTGNVGIMLHGNYVHDKLNKAQKATMRWLFSGGFLVLTGEGEHDIAIIRGHQEWPGHSTNECPGVNLMKHTRWLRNTQFH
jgi:hypothetical protein